MLKTVLSVLDANKSRQPLHENIKNQSYMKLSNICSIFLQPVSPLSIKRDEIVKSVP